MFSALIAYLKNVKKKVNRMIDWTFHLIPCDVREGHILHSDGNSNQRDEILFNNPITKVKLIS